MVDILPTGEALILVERVDVDAFLRRRNEGVASCYRKGPRGRVSTEALELARKLVRWVATFPLGREDPGAPLRSHFDVPSVDYARGRPDTRRASSTCRQSSEKGMPSAVADGIEQSMRDTSSAYPDPC